MIEKSKRQEVFQRLDIWLSQDQDLANQNITKKHDEIKLAV
jgi:hypothetical protein